MNNYKRKTCKSRPSASGVPMIGFVCQLAARRPQVALPWRLPMDWAFPMTGLVGQLAARRPQVALPGRLPMDWSCNLLQQLISQTINAVL